MAFESRLTPLGRLPGELLEADLGHTAFLLFSREQQECTRTMLFETTFRQHSRNAAEVVGRGAYRPQEAGLERSCIP